MERNHMTSFWNATLILPVAAIWSNIEAPKPTFVSDKPLDCVDVVEKVLIKTKGRLLSFRSTADKCTVIILQDKEGERPKKIVVKIDRNATFDEAE
uniref:Uncharacterized protein n=1 Tax=Rhizobium rhizogenes TaxID=359 RepID=A0A7S4ZTK7_RHIRH|nr:hypothetical protein [Rhizobium rhizogenes]QCL10019.1 hypothetical protein pC5.8d_716 [Rhizobium rhizogenes]